MLNINSSLPKALSPKLLIWNMFVPLYVNDNFTNSPTFNPCFIGHLNSMFGPKLLLPILIINGIPSETIQTQLAVVFVSIAYICLV